MIDPGKVTALIIVLIGFYFIIKDYMVHKEMRFIYNAYAFLAVGIVFLLLKDIYADYANYSYFFNLFEHSFGITLAGFLFGAGAYLANERMKKVIDEGRKMRKVIEEERKIKNVIEGEKKRKIEEKKKVIEKGEKIKNVIEGEKKRKIEEKKKVIEKGKKRKIEEKKKVIEKLKEKKKKRGD